MKELIRLVVLVVLVLFGLVLVFGFSVNGKIGSTEIDFSINGVPRYETVTYGDELYVLDRRTGEVRLLRQPGFRQLGKPFRKMEAGPPGPPPDPSAGRDSLEEVF